MGLRQRSLVLPNIRVGRVLGFCVTVPFAVIAVTPYGWAWVIFGGAAIASGLPEGALEGTGMILQVVSPVAAVWLLLLQRHTGAAVMIVVQGLAWVATSWDRHAEKFIEFAVVIAIVSLIVAVLVAITPGRGTAPVEPSASGPPG